MLSVRKLVTASIFVLAATLPGQAMADDGILGTSVGGTCNGVADTSCVYCSYEGGNTGQPISRCVNGVPGYFWLNCYTWANNSCIVG